MIRRKLHSLLTDKGFWFTFVFSLAVLIYFYGSIIRNANHTYFVTSGDGLQTYSGSLYHIEFDTTYWRTQGMNYPYGESVFFTGFQPLLINGIKAVSNVVNIAPYTVGIINLSMLFSIVLSALVLYLILRRFKLPFFYCAIAATGIAFMSPQIHRLAGHFTLTYQFAIPLFIYGLIRFYESPSYRKSIWIGIFVFLITATHMYFLAFVGALSLFYWVILFLLKHERFGSFLFCLKHFTIQIIIPFLIFQGVVSFLDTATDRTVYPWGFFEYKSGWDGVFFPEGKPYKNKFSYLYHKSVNFETEGQAYIGIVALVAFVILVVNALLNLMKLSVGRTNIKSGIAHPLLGIFFWASFFILLYSFAIPIEGREWVIRYLGPLKQMRGLGRFSWMFYYLMNIIAFVQFYEWTKHKKWLNYIICGVALYMICFDGRYANIPMPEELSNSMVELDDVNNTLPVNQWVKKINPSDYQAMIALPYFHVGSENIWLEPKSEIVKEAAIYSLKTGLPTLDVKLSRTSIGQTYRNIQLITEPYRHLEILKDFKSRKPILVLARPNELKPRETVFLNRCTKLFDTPTISVYKIDFDQLEKISNELFPETMAKFQKGKLHAFGKMYSTDSLETFAYTGFEDQPNDYSYKGKGCFEREMGTNYSEIFDELIPNAHEGEYKLSFWMNKFTSDLYPRALIEICYRTAGGDLLKGAEYSTCAKSIQVIDGDRGLIEVTVQFPPHTERLSVTLWNNDMVYSNAKLRVDEFLVRPSSCDIYTDVSDSAITYNNRTYYQKMR